MNIARSLLAAVCCASLMNLASEPIAFAPAALFGFLPLLHYQKASGRQRFFTGWAAGFLFQALAYYWIFYTIRDFAAQNTAISATGAVLFFAFQGLDMALWLWAFPMLAKHFPKGWAPVVAAAWWFLVQTIIFPYVFPWSLGSLFTEYTWVRGTAALWGSAGLGFLICWFQAELYMGKPRIFATISVLIMLFSGHIIQRNQEIKTLRVGVVQPNLVNWAKRGRLTVPQIFDAHYQPTLALVEQKPDLIIWPESALPFSLDHWYQYRETIQTFCEQNNIALLTGTIGPLENEKRRYYNEIRLYEPGNFEPQVYRKQKLVMFSEKLPWIFSWAKYFDPHIGGFVAGEQQTPMVYKDIQLNPLVCFEALFPKYVSNVQSQLMVNLTNDAWFGKTKASAQHLQQIRMRTLETGAAMVRATNSGISCWVNQRGEIQDAGSLYENETFIYDIEVPVTTGINPSRYVYAVLLIFSFGLLIFSLGLGIRKRKELEEPSRT